MNTTKSILTLNSGVFSRKMEDALGKGDNGIKWHTLQMYHILFCMLRLLGTRYHHHQHAECDGGHSSPVGVPKERRRHMYGRAKPSGAAIELVYCRRIRQGGGGGGAEVEARAGAV